MPVFYDTHAHLDYPEFAAELPEVVERAAAAGITRVISIGTDFESSRRAIQLAEQFPNVLAVVGWHPSHVEEAPEDIRPGLRELASHPRVAAIGETGLDYHRLPGSKPGAEADANADTRYKARQAELFRQHLEVAAELNLNCVIHQRDCLEDLLQQFRPFYLPVLYSIYTVFIRRLAYHVGKYIAAEVYISFAGNGLVEK